MGMRGVRWGKGKEEKGGVRSRVRGFFTQQFCFVRLTKPVDFDRGKKDFFKSVW